LSVEAWSALAGCGGVVVAFIAMIVESKRSRLVHSIDVISNLDVRFETPEFRQTRRKAAQYLLKGDGNDDEGKEAVMDVLNFFEFVGYLCKRHVIEHETAWQFFASWLVPYYCAAHRIIQERQLSDPNCLCELKKLYHRVRKIEEKSHPSGDHLHLTSEISIKKRMEIEARLATSKRARSSRKSKSQEVRDELAG
jgi:hypothetical protein